MWLKNAKKSLKQKNFLGHFQNWGLDLKVWADPSWLLVFKNGHKKCSSLTNDWVIDISSWCKKLDEGEKGRGEGGGPARVWGSDLGVGGGGSKNTLNCLP